MKSIFTLVFSFFFGMSAWAQQGNSDAKKMSPIGGTCDVIRDIKTPLSHVFDPSTSPNIWMMPTDEEAEMPLPGGINEQLRREIDAARSARRHTNNIQNRGIIHDLPTPPNSIITQPQRGTEVPPGGGTPNDNHIAVGNDGKIVSVMNTVIPKVRTMSRVLIKGKSALFIPRIYKILAWFFYRDVLHLLFVVGCDWDGIWDLDEIVDTWS